MTRSLAVGPLLLSAGCAMLLGGCHELPGGREGGAGALPITADLGAPAVDMSAAAPNTADAGGVELGGVDRGPAASDASDAPAPDAAPAAPDGAVDGSSNSNSNSNAKLIMKTGFEANLKISVDSSGKPQDIVGQDLSTGFVLPGAFPSDFKPGFIQFCTPAPNWQDFVQIAFETLPGRSGKTTRALRLDVLGDGPGGGLSRVEYQLRPSKKHTQMYTRFWIRWPQDWPKLAQKAGKYWRQFGELKLAAHPNGAANSRYRLGVKYVNGAFTVEAKYAPTPKDDCNDVLWSLKNSKIAAPVGKWVEVEWFWRLGQQGRVWFRVDGQLVGDHKGLVNHPTAPTDQIYLFSPVKNYGDTALLQGDDHLLSWVDDLELWTDIPGGP